MQSLLHSNAQHPWVVLDTYGVLCSDLVSIGQCCKFSTTVSAEWSEKTTIKHQIWLLTQDFIVYIPGLYFSCREIIALLCRFYSMSGTRSRKLIDPRQAYLLSRYLEIDILDANLSEPCTLLVSYLCTEWPPTIWIWFRYHSLCVYM